MLIALFYFDSPPNTSERPTPKPSEKPTTQRPNPSNQCGISGTYDSISKVSNIFIRVFSVTYCNISSSS